MITILSPAKTLNLDKQELVSQYTIPVFIDDSERLAIELKKYSPKKLSILMKINSKLSQLNFERYQAWQPPFNPTNAKQTVLAFNGDVYNGLAAETFNQDDFEFAQQNLIILSGMYGVLKPLDLMQPYRLEMGTPLKTRKWKNLYDFWGNKITEEINKILDGDVLINLASNEYFKAINRDLIESTIITPVFKDYKDGIYKFVHVFGKRARGLMTRFIVQNKITDPNQIKLFDIEGYYYNDRLSTEFEWVFTRG